MRNQFFQDKEKIKVLENEKEELHMKLLRGIQHSLKLKSDCASLKTQFNKREDKYLDDILDLKENVKANENMVVKISHSIQSIHKLGPKPNYFYDQGLKNGLGYKNPYTLKKAIVKNSKLYDASSIHDSTMHVDVCNTEEILEDADKS
ncbi:hypothetical protein Tco_0356080 [Tanacetum coccineum]